MKNVYKIEIELTFPQGAHFYQNVNLLVYKKLMQFIYELNCLNRNCKCNECFMAKKCRYFHCTGENFRFYPGIIIHNDLFVKSIYQKEENLCFQFYLMGDIEKYANYIVLFFQSYLQQQLAHSLFYVKRISQEVFNDEYIPVRHLKLVTMIEDIHFLDVYNEMINYYNKNYHCCLDSLGFSNQCHFNNHKYVQLDTYMLKTKKIYRKGHLIDIQFDDEVYIYQPFIDIGIGKLNFIGGGYFENENNII